MESVPWNNMLISVSFKAQLKVALFHFFYFCWDSLRDSEGLRLSIIRRLLTFIGPEGVIGALALKHTPDVPRNMGAAVSKNFSQHSQLIYL